MLLTGTATVTWGDLSPAEQRVAALLVHGLTNRQIAAELHLSPLTVETHLKRTYGRLGLRSRAHLAALAATSLLAPGAEPSGGAAAGQGWSPRVLSGRARRR